MTKQDRRLKAQREGVAQAEEAIELARLKAATGDLPTAEAPKPKRGELSPELAAHAPAVKAAREAGTAWWKLAHELGLPGSADSVTQGKAGAGLARRIYAKAYGAEPPRPVSERVQRKRAERNEKNENVAAVKAEPRAERVERVRTGGRVIPADLPDEEVLAMLRGREITWTLNLNDFDGKGDCYSDEVAVIHPRWLYVMTSRDGDRCITFKVMDPKAKGEARAFPGATRIVRLSRIHTIK